jgi:hypothetical protein
MPAVEADRTRTELREMFYRWGVEKGNWDIEWQEEMVGTVRRRLPGVTLRYYRQGHWQVISSFAKSTRAENLRQIYLFLDRIRIAERFGVQYQNLSFTKEIVATGAPPNAERDRKEDLLDAYDTVGASPDDPMEDIDRIYKIKVQRHHPDHGGDAERFKRLTAAYELIKKSRGQK